LHLREGIEVNDFVEWFQVHSNFYGTSKNFIDSGLAEGKILLFDLDVQGAKAIKKIYGERAHVIFIEPPSVGVLEQRLKKRATDSQDVIDERLENAKRELEQKDDFDYKILNDDFDRAYYNFKSLVEKIKDAQ
jgi:guanylate kinase